MSNEPMNTTAQIDGFVGYETGVEGAGERTSHGLIAGHLVRFTNEGRWVWGSDCEDFAPGLELVAIDVKRVVQKWRDQVPVETVVLGPGERYPDIKAWNADCPQSEWAEGPSGELRGPWQSQQILYLLEPATLARFTYPTSTIGGGIAIRDLVDRTVWMRRFRGEGVYAVIELGSAHMKTRFGGRPRPHFSIKRWITFGDAGPALPAGPQAAALDAPTAPGATTVTPPSLAEETGDSIDF